VATGSVDTLTNRSCYFTGLHNVSATIKNWGITSQSNFNASCEIKEIPTYTATPFADDMGGYTNPNRGGWALEEWYRDVGDWECGVPTNVGPSSAHSGTNCWGTNLDGNYDNYGQTTFAGFVVDQGWLVDVYGRNDFIDIPAQAGDHIYINITWTTGADIDLYLYKPSDVLNHSITGDNYIAYGISASTKYETINYTTTPADGSGIYKLRVKLYSGGDTSYTINKITIDNVTYSDSDYPYSLKRVDNEATGYEYPEVTYHYFWVYGEYSSSYSISYTFEDDVDLTLYDPDGNAVVGNYYDNDGYWSGSYTADRTGLWIIKMVGEGTDHSPDNYTVYVTHPNHYAWLISPVIDLSDPNIISAEWDFWHWYDLEENYDYGCVCVGIVGYYWYLSEYYTGNNSEIGWTKETINLDSFLGYKIRLGFALITDYSVTKPGWYIDDITVNITQRQPITLFSDNMESGIGSWTIVDHDGATSTDTWQQVTSSYNSPTHSWWCGKPSGNTYQNNTNVSLVSPIFNLTNATTATLTFWHKYSLELFYDFGWIEISTDGGTTWKTLVGFSGTGSLGQESWGQQKIYLSHFAGNSSVRVRFRFKSDSSVVYSGWYIDDVYINKTVEKTVYGPNIQTITANLT
ncbi:MAG: immune inhibitor A, partial [Elusimicrobiota bacterium]|nr:immune inhibitor A [Elusimicrobiota bacterium]